MFVAGLLLGRPGHEGWIPSEWVASAVGGEGWLPTFWASLAGALMYFATLTEIPIVEGLQGAGMGNGRRSPCCWPVRRSSLPNMLVIRTVLGTRKTLVYVMLVVVFSTVAGRLLAPRAPRMNNSPDYTTTNHEETPRPGKPVAPSATT